MKPNIPRILLGVALAVTPWIYHKVRMGGDAAEQFQQSETLLMFGREISKGQYFGLLGALSLVGVIILAVGLFRSGDSTRDAD